MFIGSYEHTIDKKGRTSIPAKFRETLLERYDERLILTNSDNCIVAYPYDEWRVLMDKFSELPQFKSDVKAVQRFFLSGATECNVDRQGRILIPPQLREYANLKRELVFIGLQLKFEIWNKERWNQELAIYKEKFANSSEGLGI